MKLHFFMASGLLALPLAAIAAFGTTDVRQILSEQREIRQQVEQPLGKYSRFNDQAQGRLRRAQDVIFRILAEDKSLEQLNGEQQAKLLTAVEEVKAILANNDKDKLQCWRERKTGSNMKVTMCETVAQRERTREDARTWRGKPSICGTSADGTGCGRIIGE